MPAGHTAHPPDRELTAVPLDQVVQVAGSLLILSAFAAAQRGRLSLQSRTYLLLNLVGSLVLAVLAVQERQIGFLLLEAVWALVSGWSLVKALRGGGPAAAA